MELLFYNELQPLKNKEQFERVCDMLRNGNFAQAEVKKLSPGIYYRAKLNDSDRLLFTFRTIQEERVILILEIIYNHAYEKSRFLNGATIDETRIPTLHTPQDVPPVDAPPMIYRNPAKKHFHLLDRPLSFDELQESIFSRKLPAIIVGSAGSGKTMLSIEKMKSLSGEVLYVTRSSYLADNARRIYTSFGYDNEKQNITFASFDEVLRSIRTLDGRMAGFNDFLRWFREHPLRSKFDPHQLHEEICGVITGSNVTVPYLSLEQYQALGIRQSIYLDQDREAAYTVFTGWLSHCKSVGLYLENIVCHEYLSLADGLYDWMVIDEVQDMTNVQLFLLLKLLSRPHNFLLCGDSNQIVHPNFFSWSGVKSMFYKENVANSAAEIQILHANYRNSRNVTELANQLLRLKVARFGSVDRESNFLVDCVSPLAGDVSLLQDTREVRGEFNSKTANSVDYAVLVLNEDAKAGVGNLFQTPLVFSVREAKGLEYRNVIIYNLVSDSIRQFEAIAEGVSPEELTGELKYARNKDKSDKGLEIYKFFINSLYVALTRAVENVYWIERNTTGRIFRLLKLSVGTSKLDLKATASTLEEWRREAVKLEKQGRQEQADKIITKVLKQEKVPWEVLDRAAFDKLCQDALTLSKFNKQAKQKLLTFADIYDMHALTTRLRYTGFNLAFSTQEEIHRAVSMPLDTPYNKANFKNLKKNVERYGVDFRDTYNRTPLMMACRLGDAELAEWLLDNDADTSLEDNNGMTAYHHLLKLMFLDKNSREDLNLTFYDMVQRVLHKNVFWPTSIPYSVEEQKAIIAQRVKSFFPIFHRLAPEVTCVRIDDREFKLGAASFDAFLVNYLKANILHKITMPVNLYNYFTPRFAFSANEIEAVCAILPESIMRDYRKKHTYISSMLAKNEYRSNDKYNRKYLLRWERGQYMFSPNLQFKCNGQWMRWDEMLWLKYAKTPEYCSNLLEILFMLHTARTSPNPGLVFYLSQAIMQLTAYGTGDTSHVSPYIEVLNNYDIRFNTSDGAEKLRKNTTNLLKPLAEFLFSLYDGLPSLPLDEKQYTQLCGKKMKNIQQSITDLHWQYGNSDWEGKKLMARAFRLFECIPPLFLYDKRPNPDSFKKWDLSCIEPLMKLRREIEAKKTQ